MAASLVEVTLPQRNRLVEQLSFAGQDPALDNPDNEVRTTVLSSGAIAIVRGVFAGSRTADAGVTLHHCCSRFEILESISPGSGPPLRLGCAVNYHRMPQLFEDDLLLVTAVAILSPRGLAMKGPIQVLRCPTKTVGGLSVSSKAAVANALSQARSRGIADNLADLFRRHGEQIYLKEGVFMVGEAEISLDRPLPGGETLAEKLEEYSPAALPRRRQRAIA